MEDDLRVVASALGAGDIATWTAEAMLENCRRDIAKRLLEALAHPMLLKTSNPREIDATPPGTVMDGVGGASRRMNMAKGSISLSTFVGPYRVHVKNSALRPVPGGFALSTALSNRSFGTRAMRTAVRALCGLTPAASAASARDGAKLGEGSFLVRSPPRPSNSLRSSPSRR
jgi:hypothetical protein